jgi:two-component system, NarL family, invasion response regulator UvrY
MQTLDVFGGDMIRVFIADDHPLVRKGMMNLLNEEPDFTVCGQGGNAHEVLDGLKKIEVDVLIMDLSMPGRSGLDLLRELRVRHPRLPILIVSMHPEGRFAVRALKAGAAGYLTKEAPPDELLLAIRKVVEGRKYVSPSLAESLATNLDSKATTLPHEALSNRELQVLCLIASGKKVKEIAEGLHLSFRTIHTFRARILQKLNMKSNVELTHYAIENKLVD